ncbi:MAG: DNA primase [Thermodesulfobacteriota bacterium]
MIPPEKIEEVKERAGIVEVISEYVPLKRRGRNHLGLCPFHSEKTPSFTVSEEKKLFHCFGCQESGTVVTFLMKHEGLSFPDAVRTLARRYGVTIAEQRTGGAARADGVVEALLAANRGALEYFTEKLKGPEGAKARDYLKKRGYEGEIVERFRLGYAPESWDGLTGYLKKKSVDPAVAEKAGVLSSKDGRRFDRFRDRLMVPITDPRGKVVAFGGRELGGGEPKYLNSSESPVFKKGETLFGFYQAKQAITKEGYALVVEGYFDLLALHSHGFTNTVATMGTALTAAHIRRLKQYADAVYTLFDADEAGRKAAVRGLDIFIDEAVPARVVLLPAGSDPDDFLKKEGRKGMEGAVAGAVPLMEFFLDGLKSECDLNSADGKARYFDRAIPYLEKIKNVAEKGHYAGKVASATGIGVDAVYGALKGQPGPPGKGRGAAATAKAMPSPGARLSEATLLKVVLRHPELYGERVAEAFALFTDPLMKEVAGTVGVAFKKGGIEPSALVECAEGGGESEEVKNWMAGVLFKEDDGFVESPERMLDDCLNKVLNRGRPKEKTRELIKNLEESGRADTAREVMDGVERGNRMKRGHKR